MNPINVYNGLQEFLGVGGVVLFVIMLVTFALWTFILERFAYYLFAHKPTKTRLKNEWDARTDKTSWKAHAVRDEMVSQVKEKTDVNVGIIKTLVALLPLLGLLGTVTGMIQTFQAITLYGAGDPQTMAGGISQALVTTVLGLVVAIPTVFLHWLASSRAKRIEGILEEHAAGLIAQQYEAK